VPLTTLQELVRYWQTDYDRRKVEAQLNGLPNFITEIDGLDIHFILVRSKHESALPLIVTHGWPGSVIEQLKIIDPLSNPTAHGGSVGGEVQLASLERADEWLNSPPLTRSALRGKVVLVNFWTYTCINWRRTLPYVRASIHCGAALRPRRPSAQWPSRFRVRTLRKIGSSSGAQDTCVRDRQSCLADRPAIDRINVDCCAVDDGKATILCIECQK
jgi:hypothetical protein